MDLDEKNYKIICFTEVGYEFSALVVENLKDRQVHFLRIDYKRQQDGNMNLKLIQLGILVNKSKEEKSPVLKYRGVTKIDPKTKMSYHVGLILREKGRLEVYSDFMLVNEHMDLALQCVDIETDFNQFYFKRVKDSDKVTHDFEEKDLKYEIR